MRPQKDKTLAARVRSALRAAEDGMTTTEIAQRVGSTTKAVSRAVRGIEVCYIDRWDFFYVREGQKPVGVRPVWCIATIPENCPRPMGRTA